MGEKLRNIIEDVARDFLNQILVLRFDICTCPICKNDMLAYVLSRVPAKYVTTEQGALYTLIEQTKVEYEAEIGRQVIAAIEIVGKNPRHHLIEDKDKQFGLLLDKIRQDRGVDFRHYHRELLKRRMALRVRANNSSSYSEYLRLLIKDPEEYDKLFETLCINVSEFFRDLEVWVTVKYLLGNLIRQKIQNNDKSIKIWSAGCACGEEAYSIAITLKEILKDKPDFSAKIYATDIDKACLRNISKAEYQKEQLKNVDSQYLNKYFTALENKNYKLKTVIKDMVESQYQDLTSAELIPETDMVFCRNVFIYFNRSLQEQILMSFYRSLKSKGYMIMGKVEIIVSEAKEIFEEIDGNAHIYQKK